MACRPENKAMGNTEQDTERESKIPTAKDWFPNAAEDLGNPQNWPMAKKIYHTMIPISVAFLWYALLCCSRVRPGLMTDCSPFGSSVYTPGIEEVMTEFGVTREVALLPFTLYLIGLSFGPVVLCLFRKWSAYCPSRAILDIVLFRPPRSAKPLVVELCISPLCPSSPRSRSAPASPRTLLPSSCVGSWPDCLPALA